MTTEARKVGHTPGPWTIEDGRIYVAPRDEYAFLGEKIADVYHPHCGWVESQAGENSHPEAEANARLIAESPAMLEALERAEQKLTAYVGICSGDKELTDAVLPLVRRVLARATGAASEEEVGK
jgi:hypothetical protein